MFSLIPFTLYLLCCVKLYYIILYYIIAYYILFIWPSTGASMACEPIMEDDRQTQRSGQEELDSDR